MIVLKTFVILLLLVFGILLAIVVFGMAAADKHLVEMEDDLDEEKGETVIDCRTEDEKGKFHKVYYEKEQQL